MKESVLKSIAQKVGSPTYVYDASKIEAQFQRLQKAFQGVERLRVNYACKALSNLSILRLMKKRQEVNRDTIRLITLMELIMFLIKVSPR